MAETGFNKMVELFEREFPGNDAVGEAIDHLHAIRSEHVEVEAEFVASLRKLLDAENRLAHARAQRARDFIDG